MTPVVYASDDRVIPCAVLVAGTHSECGTQEKRPL